MLGDDKFFIHQSIGFGGISQSIVAVLRFVREVIKFQVLLTVVEF